MTPEQETNTFDWVAAMLSGDYKHGRYRLYNPGTGCHCAVGVAAELACGPNTGVIRDRQNYVFKGYDHPSSDTFVPGDWFKRRFGLRQQVEVYQSINDKTNDYYGVVALVLGQLPDSERKRELQQKLLNEVVNA